MKELNKCDRNKFSLEEQKEDEKQIENSPSVYREKFVHYLPNRNV